jgi:hypothetical protein
VAVFRNVQKFCFAQVKNFKTQYTDKKDKEIQTGAVAKSYMTNGLLKYGEIFAHFLIY